MKIDKLGVYKMKTDTIELFKNDEFLVTMIDHLNHAFYTPAIGAFMPWSYPAKFLGYGPFPAPRFQASREQWTEEDVCHFHLHMLRQQYERDAKPWIDRLVNIKRMSVPSYVVSLPPNARAESASGEKP